MFKWSKYQKQIATQEEISRIWQSCPTGNVGIVMGEVSGLIGIDIDGELGLHALNGLADLYKEIIPETLAFVTQSGGLRLLFQVDKGLHLPITVINYENHEELRFLSDGSQTVAPPSPGYKWLNGHAPHERSISNCPEWIIDYLVKKPSRYGTASQDSQGVGSQNQRENVTRAMEYAKACEPAISGSGGHNHTLKVCNAITIGFNLTDDEAYDILQKWNELCKPPWSEKELKRKIAEARKTTQHELGYLIKDQKEKPTKTIHTPIKKTPKIIQATTLMETEFPPIRWAVPELIPEGMTVFCGKPKIGKSWMIFQIAEAVATGTSCLESYQCEKGEVLYLALEDGPRRLQTRLSILLKEEIPETLYLATEWPSLKEGGLKLLEEWLQSKPNCRMIVIDTLAAFRGERPKGGSVYDQDYATINRLKQVVDKFNVAGVVIHHTKKGESHDTFDLVSGTQGILGAADVGLILKRPRNEEIGDLNVTGRDVEEQELTVKFDKISCQWSVLGTEQEQFTSSQREVIDLLRNHGKGMTPLQVAESLNKTHGATRQLLRRMYEQGLLICRSGVYSCP